METKGFIYILTNPSFKEYVKIGYADNVENRFQEYKKKKLDSMESNEYLSLIHI